MIQHPMTHLKTFSLTALIIALSAAQFGCSKDGSEKIWIDMVPTKPVVITADFQLLDTANSDLTTVPPTLVYIPVPAPWIKFSYNLTNTNSDDPTDNTVTIVGINLYFTAYTSLGVPVTGTTAFTVTNVAGYSATSTLAPYLAQVAPGAVVIAGNSNNATFNPGTYAGDFYAGSLPKDPAASTTSPSNTVLTYQVQAVFTGWFGTFDDPKKRFTKTVSFSTQ